VAPRTEPRTVLEHLIQSGNRTWQEQAAEFCRIAKRAGEDVTTTDRHLRRLASGKQKVAGKATGRILGQMFSRPIEELLQPCSQHGDTTQSPLAVVTSGESAVARSERELIAMAADRARQFAIFSPAELSGETMEQVYDDVRHLALAYPQQPLGRILGNLVTAQDNAFTLLEQRQRPQQARQLYMLAGVTGGLLAKASHDLSDPAAAMTQARAAFVCAENADHDGLRAWLRGLQSLVAYWAGRHHEAVRYAKNGAEFAERSGGTAAAWLPISEARAWAALGNVNETRRAIERAEDARSDVQGDELDELGGICTFNQTRQLYYAADALAWLPSQAEMAEDYAEQAVDAYRDTSAQDWAFGDQAGSHADLAIARIGQRQLEGAVAALAPVLELPAEQRINGIVNSVQRVHTALRRSPLSQDPQAYDLQDSIEAFTRTPASALPR
jgi:hypothetical protein